MQPQYTPDSTPLKQCTKCKQQLPATAEYFHRNKARRDGLIAFCKTCQKEYRTANRERIAETARQHYAANRERRLAESRQWFASHPEYRTKHNRAYHAANREAILERKRARYAANPTTERSRARKWRIENLERALTNERKRRESSKERRAEYAKKYRAANRNIFRAASSRRRARERDARGDHTPADVQRQYDAQKGRCYYCKHKVADAYHVDHVIPLSRGGSNGPENIVIACPDCNLSKRDRMPHEWPQGGRLL